MGFYGLIYCYELLSDKENTSADRTQNPKTSGAKANSKKIHPPQFRLGLPRKPPTGKLKNRYVKCDESSDLFTEIDHQFCFEIWSYLRCSEILCQETKYCPYIAKFELKNIKILITSPQIITNHQEISISKFMTVFLAYPDFRIL